MRVAPPISADDPVRPGRMVLAMVAQVITEFLP